MAEYRFADADHFATAEFHADREAADHLNEVGHMARLWCVAGLVNDYSWRFGYDRSIIDYGCGNGGLLSLIHSPNAKGFDFQPANVEAAKALGRHVTFKDFVAEPESSDLAVMTEVLEHMDDPHGFLKTLDANVLVASVPLGETPDNHYEFHVWGWDPQGFADMLKGSGFQPLTFMPLGMTQIWVATK